MIQTHIINLPRPWKVFFDYYGHLHLHMASMICIEEKPDGKNTKNSCTFHTFPIDSIGTVYKDADTAMNYRFFNLREGEQITILSDDFQETLDIINSEGALHITAKDLIEDLKKCGIRTITSEERLTLSCKLVGYETEELDVTGLMERSVCYQLRSSKFAINYYQDSKKRSFLQMRSKFYKFLIEELSSYMEYAPHLTLQFEEKLCEEKLTPMIETIKRIIDSFNSKDLTTIYNQDL